MNHIWCTCRFYYVQYLLSAPGPLEIDLRAESFDSVASGIECLSLTLPLIINFINFWPVSACCKSLRKYSVFFPQRRHGMPVVKTCRMPRFSMKIVKHNPSDIPKFSVISRTINFRAERTKAWEKIFIG